MTLTRDELARRLRIAREASGLKQDEVAGYLGVSRPTVAQMELGNRSITSLELDRLAHLYGRDMRDFLEPEFRPEDALVVLFRGQAALADPVAALEPVRKCLDLGREITNLERLIGIDREGVALPEYGLPVPRTRWDAIQHGERVAVAERRRLGLGNARLPNVAELLESQGVRTAQVTLPDDVSGLTVVAEDVGALVVANLEHAFARRRFSFAHEYCHALLDRARKAAISRAEERENVLEVRANAFGAAFLMPGEGVHEFVEGLAKGRPSRLRVEVFDGEEALRAEGRPEPGSQSIQIYDVVLLAHHFNVSRISALYRLKNLKIVNQTEFDTLLEQEDAGAGRAVADFLELSGPDPDEARGEFLGRFLALALEAFRRGEISRRKLVELAALVRVQEEEVNHILEESGLADAPGEAGASVPGE